MSPAEMPCFAEGPTPKNTPSANYPHTFRIHSRLQVPVAHFGRGRSRSFCTRWNQRAGTLGAKPHYTRSSVRGVTPFLPPTTIPRGLTHENHAVVAFSHRKSPAILLLWHFPPGLTQLNHAVGHFFHRKSPDICELIDRAAPSSSARLSLRD